MWSLMGRPTPAPLRIHVPEENLNLEAWCEFRGWDVNGGACRVEAELDRSALTMTWNVQGGVPECNGVEGMNEDFTGHARAGKAVRPGPFAQVPASPQKVSVDPRRGASKKKEFSRRDAETWSGRQRSLSHKATKTRRKT